MDSIEKDIRGTGRDSCIYLYFQNSEDHQPTVSDILINLLKQLLQQQQTEAIKGELKDKYDYWCRTKIFPGSSDYLDLFKAEIADLGTVYLVIDALDNCQSEQTRNEMHKLVKQLPSNVRTLFTTRTAIGLELSRPQKLHVVPDKDDITNYVKWRIQNDFMRRRIEGLDPMFERVIIREIIAASKGMSVQPL